MRIIFFLIITIFCYTINSDAQHIVDFFPNKNNFPLVQNNRASSILIDSAENIAIHNVGSIFATDIEMVTGIKPTIKNSLSNNNLNIIIAGTIEGSSYIKMLMSNNKLDVSLIKNQWESYQICVIENPFPKIKRALIIVANDRRGVAYGLFEISKQIGVSPWYWWADVPVNKQEQIFIKNGKFIFTPPSIQYRGIFINDEDWGLFPWAKNNFDKQIGNIGPRTYAKVCELLLRLKANYLWPAMHSCTVPFNKFLNNKKVADSFAIIMGSAHCEPLLFNNATEWDKDSMGEWNYHTNRQNIYNVLNKRVRENSMYENIYTIGIRGIHDSQMEGSLNITERIQLMQQVITDQREILSKHINKKAEEIPQVFIPYKEVLTLYDNGLKVPEDVTLMWVDDNYGYIRRLSSPFEQQRKGGSGVYYHVSYLGSPHEYLWLGSASPALMFTEMKKAYDFNARKMWVVNVGDIKSCEYDMSFFLDLAWNINCVNYSNIYSHMQDWISYQFGNIYSNKITKILYEYKQLAFVRRPEFTAGSKMWGNHKNLLEQISDLPLSENEIIQRINNYNNIASTADSLLQQIPNKLKPSFFQLIYFPITAASLQNKKMLIAQLNRYYALQKRAQTNMLIPYIKQCFDSIKLITDTYNNLLNGKWRGIMQVEQQEFGAYYLMPHYDSLTLNNKSSLCIAIENHQNSATESQLLKLPVFNTFYNSIYHFTIYNKGTQSTWWQAITSDKWIKMSKLSDTTLVDERISVTISVSDLPKYTINNMGYIKIKTADSIFVIWVEAYHNPEINLQWFVENNGYIAIDASKFHRKIEIDSIIWQTIPGLGYTQKAITTLPVKTISYDPWFTNNPHLEYDFYTTTSGLFDITSYVLPTFPIHAEHGATFAVSIDDGPVRIIDISAIPEHSYEWQNNVLCNMAKHTSQHYIQNVGKHTLKVWMNQSGIIFDRFVINVNAEKTSYFYK